MKSIFTIFSVAVLTAVFTPAAEKGSSPPKPFPLSKCLVSDEAFGGDMGEPHVFLHAGREVKLCCKGCLKEFNRNTAKYMKKMEQADKKVRKYPLKTCLISDEPLGEMGEPYVFIHDGREIKFCCKPCKKDFDKEPSKYLKKWDEAAKRTPKK